MSKLPLGSVVSLKNGNEVVIIGYMTENARGELYDYIAVPYPSGMVKGVELILVNTDAISNVIYDGYHDASVDDFLDRLSSLEKSAPNIFKK